MFSRQITWILIQSTGYVVLRLCDQVFPLNNSTCFSYFFLFVLRVIDKDNYNEFKIIAHFLNQNV